MNLENDVIRLHFRINFDRELTDARNAYEKTTAAVQLRNNKGGKSENQVVELTGLDDQLEAWSDEEGQ